MKTIITKYIRVAGAIVASIMFAATMFSGQAAAQTVNVADAQRIMTELGIPAGPADGKWGPQTARGLCAFRSIAGLGGGRGGITQVDMQKLVTYDSYTTLRQIKAPKRNNVGTYLVADKTCQTMTYVENEAYIKVMPISTGKPGKDTPSGVFTLGSTQKGWSCSSLYPDCAPQTTGRFAKKKNNVPVPVKGNMYNKRQVISSKGQPKTSAIYVHGSTSVPTSPASHGCIRVTVSDSDWMYDNVGNKGKVSLHVVGAY